MPAVGCSVTRISSDSINQNAHPAMCLMSMKTGPSVFHYEVKIPVSEISVSTIRKSISKHCKFVEQVVQTLGDVGARLPDLLGSRDAQLIVYTDKTTYKFIAGEGTNVFVVQNEAGMVSFSKKIFLDHKAKNIGEFLLNDQIFAEILLESQAAGQKK